MKYTDKLGLPIWDKPETDVFDIEQFNEGMQAIDNIVISILNQINDLVIGDTQIDLNGYVKEEALKEYAKRTELSKFLTQTDLLNYLDKTYLDRLATKDELSSYATTTQLQTTNNNITNLTDRITTLENSGGSGSGGSGVDLSGFQAKTDNNLTTTSKEVVGAINELKSGLDDKVNKTNITTIINNTSTDTQIPSAKAVYDELQEVFQSVSNGKILIASAITDKGVVTSNTDTFQTMANNISLISGGSSNSANYQLKSEACLDYLKYLHEQRVNEYIEKKGLFINGVGKTKEEISDWILNRDNFKYRGKLKKNGKFITDKDNCKFEIRGIGLHHILQYTNLHNKLNFETLKYYGINCIRLSIYLEDYSFASSDNQLSYGYISHPTELKAKIEELVDYCTELNLYVIIDWHVMAYGTNGQVPEEPLHATEALEFFQYFSNLYANQDNVLYELANEPFTTSAVNLVTFITPLRDAIKQNVVDPILICGVGLGGANALYNALISNGIDDVFISEHTYSKLTSSNYQTYLNSDIPLFTTEWGNSSSTGDGVGDNSIATELLDWYHISSVPHCVWKFTDQTMSTSMLKNKETINNIYYKYGGFLPSDLSENGQLYFGKFSYYAFDNYISRSPISADSYSVTYNLDDNITSSNSVTSISKNSPYETTLTIAGGYKLNSLIVSMGGNNINSTAVSDNVISISSVTGDLIITASSVLDTSGNPTITSEYNIFDLSSTTEPNTVLNSLGVKAPSNKSVSSTQKIMVTGGTTINVYTNSDNIKDMICCEYDSNDNLVSRSPFIDANNFSLTTAPSTSYILLACNCLASISVNDTETQTKVFSAISCSISSFNYVDVLSYYTNCLSINENGIIRHTSAEGSQACGYLNIPVEQNKKYYLAAPFLHDRFRVAFTSSPVNEESTQGELLYNNSLSNSYEFTATSNGYITVVLTVTNKDIKHLKMFTK